MILEEIYEPVFSVGAMDFDPTNHATALTEIRNGWKSLPNGFVMSILRDTSTILTA